MADPFIAILNLHFNINLTVNNTGYFRVYYTSLTGAGNNYGEAGAVTLSDMDNEFMAGTITNSVISLTYDYDNNDVNGLSTAGTDVEVTVVACNPGYGKPVVATGTITRSTDNLIFLFAEADRAYSAV